METGSLPLTSISPKIARAAISWAWAVFRKRQRYASTSGKIPEQIGASEIHDDDRLSRPLRLLIRSTCLGSSPTLPFQALRLEKTAQITASAIASP